MDLQCWWLYLECNVAIGQQQRLPLVAKTKSRGLYKSAACPQLRESHSNATAAREVYSHKTATNFLISEATWGRNEATWGENEATWGENEATIKGEALLFTAVHTHASNWCQGVGNYYPKKNLRPPTDTAKTLWDGLLLPIMVERSPASRQN